MLEVIEEDKIENMIYEIRGKQVMVDSDIAYLFGYETKNLNRQVQRNIDRFPENYCFQLTEEEYTSLRCQNGTLKIGRGQHKKYLPYVFTEYGITMLAGLLKSDVAVKMSLRIVDTFIAMRKFINNNIDMFKELDEIKTLTIQNTNDIKLLQNDFDKLKPNIKTSHIFFSGQLYDAYSYFKSILEQSKKEIVLIDNYIDNTVLDLVCNLNVSVIAITNKYNKIDINKYQCQYSNLTIKIENSFHDRFILIDRKILYLCGSSFKDLGKKCFGICKLEDSDMINKIINKL